MSPDAPPGDAAARERALDVTSSFIVQAPAGSGKTELLIRRFLALLPTVDEPEAVLAITFTRKAAAEMRRRILGALRDAARGGDGASASAAKLARAALAADAARGWGLLGNPSRLRILTIDALNISLARRLPVLSGLGAGLDVEERPQSLYREAAVRLLSHLAHGDARTSAAVAHLLAHIDYRSDSFVDLVQELLGRREDWLAVLTQLRNRGDVEELRALLESARHALVVEHLERLRSTFPDAALRDAITIAGTPGMPDASADTVPAWSGLADLLLTDKGGWRKRWPKEWSNERKARASVLVEELATVPELAEMLARARALPGPTYGDDEWAALAAMFEVLPLAAQELQLEFAATGRCDYPCFAAAARQALGSDDEPTEAALTLDARLRHLLVDEFQDTSLAQVRLLERLTAGWMPGDGNTLFLVGDPMQSIYRFRNAEVAQFLAARRNGIGALPLESLTLEVNFRSAVPVVQWHNDVFAQVLPAADDLRRGAVAFAASRPAPAASGEGEVVVHPFLRRSRLAEARRVADIVEESRRRRPGGTIAVLVAGRAHLVDIVPELQRRGIAYVATDIDPLAVRPTVLDLLALTRALAHLADRTAWLAVLRAPWCGLRLAELLALAGDDATPLLDRLRRGDWRDELSAEAVGRLDRVLPVLETALVEVRHLGWRDAVERAWHSLGGPATAADERGLAEAAAYLEQLSGLESKSRGPLDFAKLEEALAELYAPVDPSPGIDVQLLTIHKAKGLQFDTVILPGLERPLRGDTAGLLRWTTLRGASSEAIVVAPVHAYGGERNALYAWLDAIARDQAQHERERLLYVAATRAKSALHLLGSVAVNIDEDGVASPRAPSRGTALRILWPAVRERFERLLDEQGVPAGEEITERGRTITLQRLPAGWSLPELPPGPRTCGARTMAAGAALAPDFDWAGETARRVGTVVHQALQRHAQTGGLPDAATIDASRPLFRVELSELGVPEDMQSAAVERVVHALVRTGGDVRGRWLFDVAHRDARAELALTGRIEGELVSVAVDRTFIDTDGIRWIVDYKTSMHEGGGLDAFLDNEQARYRPQLDRYARFLQRLGPEPIRAGLYFPMLGGWREWTPE